MKQLHSRDHWERNIEIVMTVRNTTIEGVFIDILHVLGIAKNLFFVSKATSLNLVFEFNNNIVVVRNNQRKVIGEGVR
jgi:hypothetical protein